VTNTKHMLIKATLHNSVLL